jgi:hypothetical protein
MHALEPLPSTFILHIFLWQPSFNPNEAMIVSRATTLPLVPIPVILALNLGEMKNNESSTELVGGNMRVVANILPGNLDPLSSSAIPESSIHYTGACAFVRNPNGENMRKRSGLPRL